MTLTIIFVGLLNVLLSACQTSQLSLENSQIQKLTSCPISLVEARKNLLQRGYSIQEHGEDYFSTDFKKSEFETVLGFVSGETVQEYYRRFVVFSFDKDSIDYRFQYQVYRLGEPVIRMANPSFTFDKLSQYQKIRGEVCGSLNPSFDESSKGADS